MFTITKNQTHVLIEVYNGNNDFYHLFDTMTKSQLLNFNYFIEIKKLKHRGFLVDDKDRKLRLTDLGKHFAEKMNEIHQLKEEVFRYKNDIVKCNKCKKWFFPYNIVEGYCLRCKKMVDIDMKIEAKLRKKNKRTS